MSTLDSANFLGYHVDPDPNQRCVTSLGGCCKTILLAVDSNHSFQPSFFSKAGSVSGFCSVPHGQMLGPKILEPLAKNSRRVVWSG